MDNLYSIDNVRKKFHKIHELISTSYHEAGHTIYGFLHLFKIESVTVFENKKTKRIDGFTSYIDTLVEEIKDEDLLNSRLYSEIGFNYSGLVAEKHYFKMISGSDKFPMFLKDGSSIDIMHAAQLFKKYNISEPGIKRGSYKKKIIKEVDEELGENWEAITIVAHQLIKNKKLNYLELKYLLTHKNSKKEFWKKQFKKIDYFYDEDKVLDENDFKNILSI